LPKIQLEFPILFGSRGKQAMRLAIIGCGVGGLTLAKTLLHEHSQADIRLYEAWDEWKTRGGSLNLAQGGKILRYLGLEPALTAASNRPARVQQFSNGKLVGSMDLDGHSNLVMRTDLQKLLVESLPVDIIHLKREAAGCLAGSLDRRRCRPKYAVLSRACWRPQRASNLLALHRI
jgi:hypothetical protein